MEKKCVNVAYVWKDKTVSHQFPSIYPQDQPGIDWLTVDCANSDGVTRWVLLIIFMAFAEKGNDEKNNEELRPAIELQSASLVGQDYGTGDPEKVPRYAWLFFLHRNALSCQHLLWMFAIGGSIVEIRERLLQYEIFIRKSIHKLTINNHNNLRIWSSSTFRILPFKYITLDISFKQ